MTETIENVKLARYRNTSYFVKCPVAGVDRQFIWSGVKNGKVDIKPVPREVVDWLQMNTRCFENGQLVIKEEDETVVDDIKAGIGDVDSYEKNTHTKEEIVKILEGNVNKMKAELKKITVDSEKQFVADIAVELKDNLTKGKLDAIAEFIGVDSAILFG